jgi:hypothetical protein
MNTHIDTRTEALIDLGNATAETKGGAPYPVQDNLISSRKDTPQAAD